MSDCVFCQRIANADYIGCGRDTVRFEPLGPVTPGHMLFVPRKHVWDAGQMPWVTALVVEEASTYANSECLPFNLITSAGAAATQTIRHLHVHYVPRRDGDGLMLPWTVPAAAGDPRGTDDE